MAKFFGSIGYAISVETRPGVWKDQIEEREYAGDFLSNTGRWTTSSDSTNDDLTISNKLSIIADPYAMNNFHTMKYVRFLGACWKIVSIDATNRPRLILSVGGVYNGATKS